jgi:hypothetical protein
MRWHLPCCLRIRPSAFVSLWTPPDKYHSPLCFAYDCSLSRHGIRGSGSPAALTDCGVAFSIGVETGPAPKAAAFEGSEGAAVLELNPDFDAVENGVAELAPLAKQKVGLAEVPFTGPLVGAFVDIEPKAKAPGPDKEPIRLPEL